MLITTTTACAMVATVKKQTNGGHPAGDSPRPAPSQDGAPRERAEPVREARQENTQAPLDLPPPPPAKPFVVWSSGPSDASSPRRDE